jgi:hypothetical protein
MPVDYEAIVEKLARDTNAGVIRWTDFGAREIERSDVVGLIYGARVKGKKIAAYEYKFTAYDESEGSEQRREVAIEFIVGEGNIVEFRFPQTRERWDLLAAIRAQTSGVEEFAAEFLNK